MSRSNEDLVKVISEVLDLPSESDIDPRSEPVLFDVSFDSSDDEHLPTNNESGVSSLATSYVDSSSEADDTDENPNYEPSDVGSTASFNSPLQRNLKLK
ncbi:hypothetical protein J6590_027313 [Homalodisca vitripennis]|nr:hypothetical protein J6590_027313 [Homalodisca vitripennis]